MPILTIEGIECNFPLLGASSLLAGKCKLKLKCLLKARRNNRCHHRCLVFYCDHMGGPWNTVCQFCVFLWCECCITDWNQCNGMASSLRIGGLQGGEESWNLVLVRIVNGTLRTVGLALPCWVKAETLAYLCTPLWPTGSRRPPLSANHAVGNAWLRPSMLEDAKVFARFTYRRTVPLKLVIYMFLFSFLVLEIGVGVGTIRVLDFPHVY